MSQSSFANKIMIFYPLHASFQFFIQFFCSFFPFLIIISSALSIYHRPKSQTKNADRFNHSCWWCVSSVCLRTLLVRIVKPYFLSIWLMIKFIPFYGSQHVYFFLFVRIVFVIKQNFFILSIYTNLYSVAGTQRSFKREFNKME